MDLEYHFTDGVTVESPGILTVILSLFKLYFPRFVPVAFNVKPTSTELFAFHHKGFPSLVDIVKLSLSPLLVALNPVSVLFV